MLEFFKKKIRDDQEKTLETNVKAYIVWWMGGEGYLGDRILLKKKCRAFTCKQEAEEYKKVLNYCYSELQIRSCEARAWIEEEYG